MIETSYIDVDFNKPLKEYCRNATNDEGDTFVGIKSEYLEDRHLLSIHFPIGYKISDDEESVRAEIIQLISILQEYNDQQSRITKITPEQLLKTVRFPVQAYFVVLIDFINNGYYQIQEEQFKRGISGPISWNRTIKQEQPIAQENGFIYPQYRVRHHNETDKDLITEINQFCVYQSYLRLGWIYKLSLPPKPKVKRDVNIYKQYLSSTILRTFRDKDKQLFTAMYDILNFENNINDPDQFYFGTNNFEYVWEKMVQDMFGNERKDDYFPKTKWLLNIGEKENTALEPDTVMSKDNDIYVLDAKYYKFGVTNKPHHLPNSSSINKQITYGEYIATNDKFETKHNNGMEVYNAFLLPFDSERQPYDKVEGKYYSIGEAVASWKGSVESYERVQGILVDVKMLMSNTVKPNENEIAKLAKVMEVSLEQNKNR